MAAKLAVTLAVSGAAMRQQHCINVPSKNPEKY